MRDIKTITKEEFDNAYNQHLPNKFVKFIYKYFSKDTEKKDAALNNVISYGLLALFFLGFAGAVLELPRTYMLMTTVPYCIILVVLVLSLFVGIKMNNFRLKKVYTKLDITINQYNVLADQYYPSKTL